MCPGVRAGARHGSQVQRLREIHASSHLLFMRARILTLLEVLEGKVVGLVPDLIDVRVDQLCRRHVVVNLQLSREVVASFTQACATGLLTVTLQGGLATLARHLRLGSGTLVASGACILYCIGMNVLSQSRRILALLR